MSGDDGHCEDTTGENSDWEDVEPTNLPLGISHAMQAIRNQREAERARAQKLFMLKEKLAARAVADFDAHPTLRKHTPRDETADSNEEADWEAHNPPSLLRSKEADNALIDNDEKSTRSSKSDQKLRAAMITRETATEQQVGRRDLLNDTRRSSTGSRHLESSGGSHNERDTRTKAIMDQVEAAASRALAKTDEYGRFLEVAEAVLEQTEVRDLFDDAVLASMRSRVKRGLRSHDSPPHTPPEEVEVQELYKQHLGAGLPPSCLRMVAEMASVESRRGRLSSEQLSSQASFRSIEPDQEDSSRSEEMCSNDEDAAATLLPFSASESEHDTAHSRAGGKRVRRWALVGHGGLQISCSTEAFETEADRSIREHRERLEELAMASHKGSEALAQTVSLFKQRHQLAREYISDDGDPNRSSSDSQDEAELQVTRASSRQPAAESSAVGPNALTLHSSADQPDQSDSDERDDVGTRADGAGHEAPRIANADKSGGAKGAGAHSLQACTHLQPAAAPERQPRQAACTDESEPTRGRASVAKCGEMDLTFGDEKSERAHATWGRKAAGELRQVQRLQLECLEAFKAMLEHLRGKPSDVQIRTLEALSNLEEATSKVSGIINSHANLPPVSAKDTGTGAGEQAVGSGELLEGVASSDGDLGHHGNDVGDYGDDGDGFSGNDDDSDDGGYGKHAGGDGTCSYFGGENGRPQGSSQGRAKDSRTHLAARQGQGSRAYDAFGEGDDDDDDDVDHVKNNFYGGDRAHAGEKGDARGGTSARRASDHGASNEGARHASNRSGPEAFGELLDGDSDLLRREADAHDDITRRVRRAPTLLAMSLD